MRFGGGDPVTEGKGKGKGKAKAVEEVEVVERAKKEDGGLCGMRCCVM